MDSKEIFLSKFEKTKKRLVKKFPGAEACAGINGKFYIGQKGKNIIGEEYPDLATSNTVWEAWRNLDTVEYWNRINTRNRRKLRKSLDHIVVSTDNAYFNPIDYIEKPDGFNLSDGSEWNE